MVRYIGPYFPGGKKKTNTSKEDFEGEHSPLNKKPRSLEAKYHWYTCVHFNKKTRKCEIHVMRPRMCRAYPFYGHKYPYVADYYPKCGFSHLQKKPKVQQVESGGKSKKYVRKKEKL